MSGPALYEVAAIYRAQLAQLADLDLDPATVADTIESIEGDLHDKLRACIAYSLELDVLAAGAADAAKRMADRAKTLSARVDSLRAYVLTHMQGTGVPSISTDEWEAKVAKKPPAVVIADGAVIPPQYMRTPEPPPPAPDKAALKAAIQAGTQIEGVSLVSGFRLAIK